MSEHDENINGDLIKKETLDDPEVSTTSTNHPVTPAVNSTAGFYHQDHLSHPRTKENDEIWSSPWVNVMMVLFAILFMMISQQGQQAVTLAPQDDATKTTADVTIKQSDINHINKLTVDPVLDSGDIDEETMLLMPALLTEIKQYIELIGTDKIKARLLMDYSLKVSLSASILFNSDSTEISEQARLFLDKLSTTLKKNTKQIQVIGHTDDQAIDEKQFTDKWQLSLMRATTVTRYLITQGQVEAYKFTIMGRSEYEPVTANLNDEARAINRRVDIIITTNASRSMENRL